MLQQTQAATVIPYFNRFMEAFPTLASLARADEQQVLRLWEGLGYYRRARSLHQAARILVAEHRGRFPYDAVTLRRLPGLGRYTVNAILSQAFDARLPILEANSQRVLSRVFGRTEDPRQGSTRAWLWQAAEELLPKRGSGELNQALMELGALVCKPTAPQCSECPLAGRCAAFQVGMQESIPPRAPTPPITNIAEAAAVVHRGGRVLLVQRPATAPRWAGLWEFPHGEIEPGEAPADAARRIAAQMAGVDARLGTELLTFTHGITRFRITLHCYELEHISGELHSSFYAQGRWLTPPELADWPVSSPQRRLASAVAEPDRQRRLF
jgi:A/G-specific adenine glycosylase